jgi:replicative DNA helicase
MTDQQQHSRENEVALLGAVMRDGTLYERAREVVQSGDFGWNAYSWAWDAFENLHQQNMGIDTITVGDELERMGKIDEFQVDGTAQWNGRAALSKIRESGEPRNYLSYAENVKDYAAKRQMLQFLNKGASWALNGRRAKDIIADMMQEFGKVTIYGAQDEFTVPISTAVSEAYDWTDRASRNEVVGVPTGFIDLDKLLGSLIAENVYIIAGRPGQGKTGLLLSIARNVAKRKKRVGIFSLEMSRLQVAQRLISQEAEVDLQSIIQGTLQDKDWPIYTHAVEIVADLPIVINDLSSININQIRQTARKIKASGGLDLLIVDYIQLASGEGGKYERRDLEVSSVSRGLKYLARELEVPILAAAQLSRAVEQRSEKKPILSDLRESGSLEQDAYAVMFIYRPDQYGETEKQNVAEIVVAKHRNGPTNSIDLIFRSSFAKFENASTKVFRPNE